VCSDNPELNYFVCLRSSLQETVSGVCHAQGEYVFYGDDYGRWVVLVKNTSTCLEKLI